MPLGMRTFTDSLYVKDIQFLWGYLFDKNKTLIDQVF